MQIIENFLPEDEHKEYFEHYHSLTPVWRFVQKANSNADRLNFNMNNAEWGYRKWVVIDIKEVK